MSRRKGEGVKEAIKSAERVSVSVSSLEIRTYNCRILQVEAALQFQHNLLCLSTSLSHSLSQSFSLYNPIRFC